MKTKGMGCGDVLLLILTAVFVTLKVTHVITWSWWLVFAPIWIPVGISIALGLVVGIIALMVKD